MSNWITPGLIWFAVIGSALMAGVPFIFSITIMQSLEKLPAPQGIAAVQQINRTILNPLFGLAFFGTGIVAIVLGIMAFRDLDTAHGRWVLTAAVAYVVSCWVVTIAFNVPRNDTIDALDPNNPASTAVWTDYVREWTLWNHVRTVGAIATLIAFVQASRSS